MYKFNCLRLIDNKEDAYALFFSEIWSEIKLVADRKNAAGKAAKSVALLIEQFSKLVFKIKFLNLCTTQIYYEWLIEMELGNLILFRSTKFSNYSIYSNIITLTA